MTKTDTIGRVPRPRKTLSVDMLAELGKRRDALSDAQRRYRLTVIQALSEASFSEVANATGLSKDTLQRWKREGKR